MSRIFERMLEKEIDATNDHLPAKRISLQDIKGIDSPAFPTRAGEQSMFLQEEIDMLLKDIPEQYYVNFMLPIVILRRMDLGAGIYTITGSKPELFYIHYIIGQVDLEWGKMRLWKSSDRLARPQVQILRRKLPSTTTIGFTTAFVTDDKQK